MMHGKKMPAGMKKKQAKMHKAESEKATRNKKSPRKKPK